MRCTLLSLFFVRFGGLPSRMKHSVEVSVLYLRASSVQMMLLKILK